MPIIFHIDVNSAFLSWTAIEQLKQGSEIDLRTVPAIIGGDKKKRHGVVLAKSIPAKKYGIQTGEPVVDAFRKCPNLVMAAPDHRLYSANSKALMTYLGSTGGVVEQVSIDECYMDYTNMVTEDNPYMTAAMQIKNEVKRRFLFTVNIGISSNKLLAKMASDFQKPDKIHTLFPEEIEKKMWPLPVGELYMVGRSSVETLKKLEINTIADLARMNPDILELHLKSHGRKLWEFANGLGDSRVSGERGEAKGIGNSTTLPEDLVTFDAAGRILEALAKSVSGRLKKAGKKAGNVSVEIKYSDFTSASHQRQLRGYVIETEEIKKIAEALFDEKWNRNPVRLLGIRTTKLVDIKEPEQLTLFAVEEEMIAQNKRTQKNKKLAGAMEELKEKYGKEMLKKGVRINEQNQ